jgi:hypothetical protein
MGVTILAAKMAIALLVAGEVAGEATDIVLAVGSTVLGSKTTRAETGGPLHEANQASLLPGGSPRHVTRRTDALSP